KIEKTKALVVFSFGSVTSNGKALKKNDVVNEGGVILTGKKSICDVVLITGKDRSNIRLKSGVKLTILPKTAEKFKDIFLKQDSGTVLFNVQKKKDREFNVITPTSTAGVRGTKFEISLTGDGSSKLSVFEGKVAFAPIPDEFNNLPRVLIDSDKTLQKVSVSMQSLEVMVDKGFNAQFDLGAAKKILAGTELAKVLQENPQDLATKLKSIDIDKVVSQVKAVDIPKPSPKAIEEQTFQEKLKEYEELLEDAGKEPGGEGKETPEAQNKREKKRELLMKRIEKVLDKPAETLILTNGKKVKGVIFEEGNSYIVLTPDGKKILPKEQVKSFSF
ncbi:MAG: FecR family protein, partial [Spirochaetota bacterium]